MAEYRQNADWREADHPRDEDGKFASKSTRVVKAKYRVSRDALTRQEWACYYRILAEIKAQCHYLAYCPKDNIYIRINNKIVLTTHKNFGSERVIAVYYFSDKEKAIEYLNVWGKDDVD